MLDGYDEGGVNAGEEDETREVHEGYVAAGPIMIIHLVEEHVIRVERQEQRPRRVQRERDVQKERREGHQRVHHPRAEYVNWNDCAVAEVGLNERV